MQFTLVQNNGSWTWRFETANPCHNSVENGSAVCLKQKERGSNFTSDANTGDIYVLTLKNSTKAVALVVATLLLGFFCYLRWRNLKRMEQEGERKTNQDKFMFLLRSKITPFSECNNSEKFGFGKNKGQQLQLYSLPQIAAATKNFSINKKLGQDPTKSKLLGWNRRFSIIEGVAQGLLYLHKYSRMRVIHRDLKASNILLDDQMNPKISDFGLAKIFGQNESKVNTNRTVGTYGYMSLEYAMNGIFSVKSDVFSFGVLLLEIVSGKKNAVFSHLSGPLSLIEHTWDLWKKGISLELTDPVLSSQCPENELLRYIHVGLLCVQECAIDRPTMSDIICMLTNVTTILPDPKRPAFYTGRSGIQAQLSSTGKTDECSLNCVSISVIEAR
ncbi:hypothetical protein ACSBR2_005697 [Camellia fascicularis]